MPRILALDYGIRRTGIAATDPLKMIASPLTVLPAKEVIPFLKDYMKKEEVELLVIGQPNNLDNTESETEVEILVFIEKLKKEIPAVPIRRVDERFTSRLAQRTILDAGIKKMKRRDKSLVDQVSAVLILQSYLDSIG